jgi:hypothetical protein
MAKLRIGWCGIGCRTRAGFVPVMHPPPEGDEYSPETTPIDGVSNHPLGTRLGIALTKSVGLLSIHKQQPGRRKKSDIPRRLFVVGYQKSYCFREPTQLVHGRKNRRRDSNW